MENNFRYSARIDQIILKKIKFYASEILQPLILLSILLFLLAPVLVCIIISFNPRHVVFPPEGFNLTWYLKIFKHEVFLSAARVSFFVACLASLISVVIGTLSSFALVRYDFRGKNFFNALFLSPMLIPSILLGLALHQLVFILGAPKSFAVLVIGHILITIPYPIRTVTAVLGRFDRSLEEAAMISGANPVKTFLMVTLPLIKPGIIAGITFAFIISWNDFVISIFLATSASLTLPIQIAAYIEYEYTPILAAISTIVIFISGLGMIVLDRTIGISALYKTKR